MHEFPSVQIVHNHCAYRHSLSLTPALDCSLHPCAFFLSTSSSCRGRLDFGAATRHHALNHAFRTRLFGIASIQHADRCGLCISSLFRVCAHAAHLHAAHLHAACLHAARLHAARLLLHVLLVSSTDGGRCANTVPVPCRSCTPYPAAPFAAAIHCLDDALGHGERYRPVCKR